MSLSPHPSTWLTLALLAACGPARAPEPSGAAQVSTVALPSAEAAATAEPAPDVQASGDGAGVLGGTSGNVLGDGASLLEALDGSNEAGGFGLRGAEGSAAPASPGGTVTGTVAPTLGTPPGQGSSDRAAIQVVMRRSMGEIRACYEQRLAARPELEARLVVRFVVGPSGEVARAEVESSDAPDAGLEQCLVGVVSAMRFPEPSKPGPVVVRYPFVFRSAD